MGEDKCSECWWYWTGVYGENCQNPDSPYDYDSVGQHEPCGLFERKSEPAEHDDYERFQKEWN